jgi:hypothetical protein
MHRHAEGLPLRAAEKAAIGRILLPRIDINRSECALTGELGTINRYSYWSDRRIRSIAADNSVDLERRWLLGIKFPTLLSFLPAAEFMEQQRIAQHHEIARKLERAIGQSAVEDFVTPPPTRFAKGNTPVTLAAYTRWHAEKKSERKGVIAHTRTVSSDGSYIEVCLFGSIENCADYLSASDAEAPTWSSSSTRAIEEFVRNRGTTPAPIYDDDESIAVEIVRVFNNEGMTSRYVFGQASSSEWFAEVYLDTELDKSRWNLRPGKDWPHHVDRIIIGAPLWVRS